MSDRRSGTASSRARNSGDSAATRGPARCVGSSARHGRGSGRSCSDGDRSDLAAIGVRRPRGPGLGGSRPAHSACRITGTLRGSRRRQPSPFNLSDLRPRRGCRLRGRARTVSRGQEQQRLRDRRGRSLLLGTLSGLRQEIIEQNFKRIRDAVASTNEEKFHTLGGTPERGALRNYELSNYPTELEVNVR